MEERKISEYFLRRNREKERKEGISSLLTKQEHEIDKSFVQVRKGKGENGFGPF